MGTRILDPDENVEIEFFHEDPDGDEGRAGDGFYFKIDGVKGWDGAYQSEAEAREYVPEALDNWERGAITKALVKYGYGEWAGDDFELGLRRWVSVDDTSMTAYSQFCKTVVENNVRKLVPNSEKVMLHTVEIDGGLETYGHRLKLVPEFMAVLMPDFVPAQKAKRASAPKGP